MLNMTPWTLRQSAIRKKGGPHPAVAVVATVAENDDFDQGPGWFHNEIIQLSLDMKKFLGAGVTTGRGTLPQLRDQFMFSRVFKDTKKCLNPSKRFHRFSNHPDIRIVRYHISKTAAAIYETITVLSNVMRKRS